MEIKLKPCPFCGKEPRVSEARNGECRVECFDFNDCAINPRTHWYPSMQEAANEWNRRADNG